VFNVAHVFGLSVLVRPFGFLKHSESMCRKHTSYLYGIYPCDHHPLCR
jgi:hypothetical protein